MAATLTIVGLGGSVAEISRSRAALHVAVDGAASAGAETELLDLRELALPMYNPDNDAPSPAAARLIESCYAADGMLWSSPMYQGTISGAFKNALDWLHVLGSREPPFLHAWGAETRSSCRGGDVVLVDESAEQVAAVHVKSLRRVLRCDC
jgi:FMN reductase